jgi:hypothetical protein
MPVATICARALILMLPVTALGGCARWEPESRGPVQLVRACPLQRAPAVGELGDKGLRGAYHFVIQDAADDDLTGFLAASEAEGFKVILLTLNINGKDTVFAMGPDVLMSQAHVDAEFDVACALGRGKVYLTHVRYDPPDPAAGPVRVR